MTKPCLRKGTCLFSWPLCGCGSGVKTQEVNKISSARSILSEKAFISGVDLSKKFVLATAQGMEGCSHADCGDVNEERVMSVTSASSPPG